MRPAGGIPLIIIFALTIACYIGYEVSAADLCCGSAKDETRRLDIEARLEFQACRSCRRHR